MIYLEMKDLGLVKKNEHKKRVLKWDTYLKSKLPNNITFRLIPLHFNYFYEANITNFIEEKLLSFLKVKEKSQQFYIICKIFQYPNRVLSIRLALAYHFKISSERKIPEEIDNDIYQFSMDEEEDQNPEQRLIK
jgi:hypothetical protein